MVQINRFIILLLTVAVINSCKSQEVNPAQIPPELDALRKYVPDSLKYLLPLLDSVFILDQQYRKSNNPDTLKKYANKIAYNDSINLIRVTPIIERYGILGFKEIGAVGYYAIVKTLQHADLSTQEKYLPLFREAITKKRVLPETYAMLEDRIAIKKGQMQIYGTQVIVSKKLKELLPTKDIDSIDSRRQSIGMVESIEIYLKRFGIKWDIEKYKKELPKLIEKYKLRQE